MDFKGLMIAPLTIVMDHMFNWLPDMYIMNAFMRIDLPGPVAKLIAMDCFLRTIISARCFSFTETSVDVFLPLDWIAFSSADIFFIPKGKGIVLVDDDDDPSISFALRSMDHFLYKSCSDEVEVLKKRYTCEMKEECALKAAYSSNYLETILMLCED